LQTAAYTSIFNYNDVIGV